MRAEGERNGNFLIIEFLMLIAARTKEYEDRFLSPFVAAERGYIDDVIMPHSTRRRIARALAMLKDKHVEMPAKKHDNLPL